MTNKKIDTNYFAYVNSIQEVDNELFIELDCVSDNWVNINIQNKDVLIEKEGFSSSLVTTQTSINHDFFNSVNESEWYFLTISKEGLDANLYPENATYNSTSQPIKIVLTHIDKSKLIRAKLDFIKSHTSLDKFQIKDSEKEILALLSQMEKENYAYEYVSAYGVGQGNANAICDIYGLPIVYFDLGGGFGWNWFTYLKTKEFYSKSSQLVILSHWDTDHFESANRQKNKSFINDLKWLVPYQENLGPRHINFANKLFKKGNLLIFPDRLYAIKTPFGNILKCTGKDRNNSGLALSVNLSKTHSNEIKKVLLPGDADYSMIPIPTDWVYDGIMATHHGANFVNSFIPSSSNSINAIVYSYGLGNIYDHPRKVDSIEKHELNNWINRKDISNTNIAFYKGIEERDLLLHSYLYFPFNFRNNDMCIHQFF